MYQHVMLISGNDERGIDVGLTTKPGFLIKRIRSNADRHDSTGENFSRDCPQFDFRTPGGIVHILVNHFKSQSGGGGAKRERQANAARFIADVLVATGEQVVVMGELNEGPTDININSTVENFAQLYSSGALLVDCYSLLAFETGPDLAHSICVEFVIAWITYLSQTACRVFSPEAVFSGTGCGARAFPDLMPGLCIWK